ncbi:MAG TPA: hypothetical protein VNY25_09815 [Steroidobacteraceae bacterium]|nr:hypothetical protein [Steroidobacteraceae bacterium]
MTSNSSSVKRSRVPESVAGFNANNLVKALQTPRAGFKVSEDQGIDPPAMTLEKDLGRDPIMKRFILNGRFLQVGRPGMKEPGHEERHVWGIRIEIHFVIRPHGKFRPRLLDRGWAISLADEAQEPRGYFKVTERTPDPSPGELASGFGTVRRLGRR